MKNIYFNHDGNVDDLISLLLLLQASDIKLLGVGVVDADGYLEPAAEASRKIIDRFNRRGDQLSVAKSVARAHHQFPKEWRLSSFAFNHFPILNEPGVIRTPEAPLPAHLDMIEKIQAADGPVTLIMTGPISDLALALDADPSIEAKIEKLYWMGGSLDGHGNVLEPGFDGTAEWNAFWDPEAVARVWQSKLDIQMVGLESTEEIPLTQELQMYWASRRQEPAFDLIGQGYSLVLSYEANSVYYLWDVLTTLSALKPELVETERTASIVRVDGPAAGRTERAPHGTPMTLVTKADKTAFFTFFDQLASSAILK